MHARNQSSHANGYAGLATLPSADYATDLVHSTLTAISSTTTIALLAIRVLAAAIFAANLTPPARLPPLSAHAT